MILNLVAFLAVFTLIVFVHELGHYLVARWNGVKIDVFAIGFGKELFGLTDRNGTRWKFCAVPLGGYVKMYGDENVASTGPVKEMSPEMKKNWELTVHSKSPWQRAAVAVAGPAANYVFAIIAFFFLFSLMGKPYTEPVIAMVQEESAAAQAGLQLGDRILEVDGSSVESFEELAVHIKMHPGKTSDYKIERDGEVLTLPVTPTEKVMKDVFGNENKMGQLGINSLEKGWKDVSIFGAFTSSFSEVYFITSRSLEALGQMIVGSRSAEELGGPIRIFQMSGKVAEMGIAALISFTALLSISLGLINLFPIPALDGGHIVMCVAEGIIGRPLNEKFQEYITIVGVSLLIFLMLFATWNDLSQLKVFEWAGSLFTKS